LATTTSTTSTTTTAASMWFICYFSLWIELLGLINPSGKNQGFRTAASFIHVRTLATWSLSPKYAIRILMNKLYFGPGYFDEVERSKV
jgi:hypothetical protein